VRRSLPALLVSAASALTAFVVWVVATRTGRGVWLDEQVLAGFEGLGRPRLDHLAERAAAIVDPAGFAFLATLVVGAALVRGRLRLASVVVAVLAAANLTTQALKALLPSSTPEWGVGAWPSGHATAVMALVLCAVLVAPPRVRPFVAAAGGLVATAVAYSLLILSHHLPGDVVGGYLVAVAWTALGVAALNAADRRWAAGHPRAAVLGARAALLAPAAGAAVAVVAAGVLAATRLDAAMAYADRHTVFVAGAVALGAAALAGAAVTAAAVRGS
jgi:membrane-associated phospholipid phosphatase